MNKKLVNAKPSPDGRRSTCTGRRLLHLVHKDNRTACAGKDISNLLDGMGMQQGMGKLFARVSHVLHIFIVVKLLTGLLPICEALVSRHGLQLTQQGLRHAWFVAAKSWLHVGLMFT